MHKKLLSVSLLITAVIQTPRNSVAGVQGLNIELAPLWVKSMDNESGKVPHPIVQEYYAIHKP